MAAWRDAYRGLIPDAILNELSVAARTARWKRIITNTASKTRVWVADEDRVIGFASTGPAEDADAPAGTAELYTLYLEPSWIGRGVGKALETTALDDLRDQGFHAATLWVLEANSRARAFYEHRGWSADGDAQD